MAEESYRVQPAAVFVCMLTVVLLRGMTERVQCMINFVSRLDLERGRNLLKNHLSRLIKSLSLTKLNLWTWGLRPKPIFLEVRGSRRSIVVFAQARHFPPLPSRHPEPDKSSPRAPVLFR